VILREASRAEAQDWFGRLHYTRSAAGHRFLLAEGLAMVGIGRGGNRFGVADKFGLLDFPGGFEITRVACHPTAPRNTASRTVAAVLKLLGEEGTVWVFSYADSAQGHHGGIYQALGAWYVGTDAKQWVNFALDGERVAKRKISGMFGHTRWPEVRDLAAAKGHSLERVAWAPKHTYILACAQRKDLDRVLSQRVLPYPKRDQPVVPTPYRNHRPK
jgi:hypothetical protein